MPLNPFQAALEAIFAQLNLPNPSPDGCFHTMNNTGVMYATMNDFTKKIIDICAQPKVNILEVGPAYGETCLAIMKKTNVESYTCVDMDVKHLKVIARRVLENLPTKIGNLRLIEGGFPDKKVTKELDEGGYDFIIMEQVIHFFTPEECYEAIRQFNRLLKPGGKLLITSMTPYISVIKKEFRDNYHKDVKKFLSNDSTKESSHVPGFYKRFKDVVDYSAYGKEHLDAMNMTDHHGFSFDYKIVEYFLEREELRMEGFGYLEYKVKPFHLNGEEVIYVMGSKPE